MILGVLLVGSLIWYLATTRRSSDLQLIGTVDANEVIVSSKIPGRIQTLTVEEGQDVKQGELIAVIESQDLQGGAEGRRGDRSKRALEAEQHRRNGTAKPRRDFERSGERGGAGAVGAGRAGAGPGAV